LHGRTRARLCRPRGRLTNTPPAYGVPSGPLMVPFQCVNVSACTSSAVMPFSSFSSRTSLYSCATTSTQRRARAPRARGEIHQCDSDSRITRSHSGPLARIPALYSLRPLTFLMRTSEFIGASVCARATDGTPERRSDRSTMRRAVDTRIRESHSKSITR
jgi:hypothetical protein